MDKYRVTTEIKAVWSIFGSGKKGWINPSREGRIIDRAMRRLSHATKRNPEIRVSAPIAGPMWCHYSLNGKTITYREWYNDETSEITEKISVLRPKRR